MVSYQTSSSVLATDIDGPFRYPNSSYTTSALGYLGQYDITPNLDLSSFTLSFFLRVRGNETVGIYQDFHTRSGYSYSYQRRFSIVSFGQSLELHIHDSSANSKSTIASYTFANVLKKNEWTFVAMVFSAYSSSSRGNLILYDSTGNAKEFLTNVQIDRTSTKTIMIGQANRFGDEISFPTSASIACLSLYDVALPQVDVALLPCACQFKDKLAP